MSVLHGGVHDVVDLRGTALLNAVVLGLALGVQGLVGRTTAAAEVETTLAGSPLPAQFEDGMASTSILKAS
jgi:hypothetical protein